MGFSHEVLLQQVNLEGVNYLVARKNTTVVIR